nr:unnamed protein product [Digitaria exilis]
MKVERDLHMRRGDGDNSYASNSRLQEKAILKTRPVLHEAVAAAAHASSLSSAAGGAMVVADLGCSSGPNTLLVASEVLGAVADRRDELALGGQQQQVVQHVQFFLNDLPGNDFNLVFQSLELFKKLMVAKDKGDSLPKYYVAGLPGSFYTRLFPDRSVPEELARGTVVNEGNMYIWEATPPSVVKLYQKQFQEDFSLFLKVRHKELVSNGQMVLAFLGRKNKDVLRGEVSYMWGLLAQALQSLVKEGRVEKERLDSFNLPFYAPSVDEVRNAIKQSEAFDINHIQLFESNWDPYDDMDDSDVVLDSVQSGVNVAQCIRAVIEPLISHHFGEHVLDDLFEIYARNVAAHLKKVKTKYPVIVLSLKARRPPPKYPAMDICYPVFTQSQHLKLVQLAMKVERDLHMSRGDGDTSYASNSRLQEKAILKTRAVLHEAVAAASHASSLSSAGGGAMVVADLGCSSGPNTLLVVSEVLGAVADCRDEQPVQHVQFFLNDLPGNDFNLVFQSLELFRKLMAAKDKGDSLPPYYVAGLPGSFYTRLFPDRSVPEELARGTVVNKGNMYIWEATPPSVVKLYQKQFLEDFSLFLKVRHKELVSNGQMVLAFLGRKNKDVLRGEISYMWGLLAQALQSLVKEGRVEKEKLDSFNLPFYAPSVDEVRDAIKQSEVFDINHIQLFVSNWDPYDDMDDSDVVLDSVQSGVNVAQCIRAVIEPLITHHFGEHVLDDLFEIYARNVAAHLRKVKTKHHVIVLSLKARRAPPKYPANGDCYSLFAHGEFK